MSFLSYFLSKIENNDKYSFRVFVMFFIFASFLLVLCFYPCGEFYPGDDTDFHLQRMQAMMDALKNGKFPIYLDNKAIYGMGYPSKWFYPDILLLPFAILGNLTDIELAFKVSFFTFTLFCGIFMYIFMYRVCKEKYTAYVGAFLYTFSLYRVQDLFERMAIGEAFSFTFIPIVLLGLYEIIKGDYNKWYILAIGYSLMVLNHVISSIMITILIAIILIVYCKYLIKEKKRIISLILAGLTTCLITAYYIYPLLEQMASNTFFYNVYNWDYKYVHDFFANAGTHIGLILWGLGLCHVIINTGNNFTPTIGILLTSLISLRFYILIRKTRSTTLKFADKCTIAGIFFLFASSNLFPWGIFPFYLLDCIQFPWRFFIFSTLFFSIAGSIYLTVSLKKQTTKNIAFLIVIIVTIGITIQERDKVHRRIPYRTSVLLDGADITKSDKYRYGLGFLEYIPARVKSPDMLGSKGSSQQVSTLNKETIVSNYNKTEDVSNLDIEINNPEKIELPILYYKGYTASLNGKEIPVLQSDHGFIYLPVEESGHITVQYTGTFVQKISPLISIISILLLCLYWFRYRKKTNPHTKVKSLS